MSIKSTRKLEKTLSRKTLSSKEVQEIAEYFCSYFLLKSIPIEMSHRRMKTTLGRYFIDNNRIVLYKTIKVNNIATLLHELAHHLGYVRCGKANHRREFHIAHVDSLNWYYSIGKWMGNG